MHTIHPGANKMYHDMKRMFQWPGMKRDIAQYIQRCEACQQVKVEHWKPGGLLHALPISKWKWEHSAMDFDVGLSKSQ